MATDPKDYFWYKTKNGKYRYYNPRWGKSDFQDVFYHAPKSENSNLIWFMVGMIILVLMSWSGH